MVEEFNDFTRKYYAHHGAAEHGEGAPDEQDEWYLGDAGEQENSGNQDFPKTGENYGHDHNKHCPKQGFEGLPYIPVEGVLNSMFQVGDHLEVFFENEMSDSGGTFVEAFDNILIWMDYDANINITDLSGPISVRKMGTKKKNKLSYNGKHKNNTIPKRDNQNDKKKKDKAEKPEKGSRKKAVNKERYVVNEELLNFAKLEREEHGAERGSQEDLTLQQLHEDNQTTENESFSVEILEPSDSEESVFIHDSFDGKGEVYIQEPSDDTEEEAEYAPQLETEVVQSEKKELDLNQDLEEKNFGNESD
ncbi:hypothetical protein [Halobacillus sp. K22]|uniref:hypothetical protein n=1 Tax=Halobacillus sp. K22 TaxID=3457431 RepID=UPI003FCC343B